MFHKLFKKIFSVFRQLWDLMKKISETTPTAHQQKTSFTHTPSKPKIELIEKDRTAFSRQTIRHRYIELEGYAESLRIDPAGRYDLKQLARFAENFVYVHSSSIPEFVDSINYDFDYVDGQRVLWIEKSDAVEWCYMQYSPLADLL